MLYMLHMLSFGFCLRPPGPSLGLLATVCRNAAALSDVSSCEIRATACHGQLVNPINPQVSVLGKFGVSAKDIKRYVQSKNIKNEEDLSDAFHLSKC